MHRRVVNIWALPAPHLLFIDENKRKLLGMLRQVQPFLTFQSLDIKQIHRVAIRSGRLLGLDGLTFLIESVVRKYIVAGDRLLVQALAFIG
jgi:hypothetical protein